MRRLAVWLVLTPFACVLLFADGIAGWEWASRPDLGVNWWLLTGYIALAGVLLAVAAWLLVTADGHGRRPGGDRRP